MLQNIRYYFLKNQKFLGDIIINFREMTIFSQSNLLLFPRKKEYSKGKIYHIIFIIVKKLFNINSRILGKGKKYLLRIFISLFVFSRKGYSKAETNFRGYEIISN